MKFENIHLINFRNYEDIEIDISNKNVFFGLNDVGKTNFLCALRFIFDKEIRKNGFLDTDYHDKNTNKPIEMIVKIDISDEQCDDNKKLRARLKGALMSSDNSAYIKLVAKYDQKEMLGNPEMYWGGNIERLQEIKSYSYSMEIDYIFNVFYIDAYVDMYNLFKKNINVLIKNDKETDENILGDIDIAIGNLNNKISTLSGIKGFEQKITPEYKRFKNENIEIAIKSEIAIKGLYSNLVPYIKQENTDSLYPTSGEGRKKILTYSMYDMISEEEKEKKINLFLIEEPENHLHKSMQIAISKILFNDKKYEYLFVTTHSPYILYEMDDVNLVRIYNENRIDSSSVFYKVPKVYRKYKKILNKRLSEAIFSNKVLLVEGPSEITLFEKVLSEINPFYESDGNNIIDVGGVGFDKYIEILKPLHIEYIIKTDNDLRKYKEKYSVLGFSRCNKLIGKDILPTKRIDENSVNSRKNLYDKNKEKLDKIRQENKIFLSKVDLENDLDEILHAKLVKCLKTSNPVEYLQDSKSFNMEELVEKLTTKDCKIIYESYNFECLKEVLK
ncbi:MAG TPA: AAA family ATPase [Clostridiales bacterium]|jgi:putative ATP-dependent endonuclease of OLD family|nr:AAA family ATPase [Clostridiales bacterium]